MIPVKIFLHGFNEAPESRLENSFKAARMSESVKPQSPARFLWNDTFLPTLNALPALEKERGEMPVIKTVRSPFESKDFTVDQKDLKILCILVPCQVVLYGSRKSLVKASYSSTST